jgi:hypothetical protein
VSYVNTRSNHMSGRWLQSFRYMQVKIAVGFVQCGAGVL